MTTLELFKKHRKGEVSRERFLYEVRRDSNLPWVTNTTSYADAVKILKNKGIIREAQFEPQNIATDPVVDRVNPYALKREVEKLLSKETELTNDSYKQALNKAAKKLQTAAAVKKAILANAEDIEKKDATLQMQPVKKANHVDKANGMKKTKGQQAPKATSAPTKENRKTKKPKGVTVMKDKGVEGSEKIIKEISEYLKKKLRLSENSTYNDFHEGMTIPFEEGEGVVKQIRGGTLEVEMPDGSLKDVQMNHAQALIEKQKEHTEEINEFEDWDNASAELPNEDYWEEADDEVIRTIQSQIETSSVFDIGFKEYALEELEKFNSSIEEGNWHEALLSLEDIDDAIQQVNPKEYQQAYARLFNTAIAKLEVLDEKNEDWEEEEIDERLYKAKKGSTVVSVTDPARDPLAKDPEFRAKFEPMA